MRMRERIGGEEQKKKKNRKEREKGKGKKKRKRKVGELFPHIFDGRNSSDQEVNFIY